MLLRLIPVETKIRFVRFRKLYFIISLVMLVAAAAAYGIRGLNYGIDFQGGVLLEVRAVDDAGNPRPADLTDIRQKLAALEIGEISVQEFGAPSDVMIRVARPRGADELQVEAITRVKEALGEGYDYRREEFVGPTVGEELVQAGITATILALLGIMAYVWIRFEWQFGVAAVVALAHDVLLTLGLFAEIQLEFNLATVAAVLTVAGYSINDTVVVFDRVRENLRKYKKAPLTEVMNRSLNDVLSRTIITSVTTLLALFALFIFGGPIIQDFAIALIWGVVIGTYSSICLAVPLLLFLNVKRGRRAEEDDDEEEGRKAGKPGDPAPARS